MTFNYNDDYLNLDTEILRVYVYKKEENIYISAELKFNELRDYLFLKNEHILGVLHSALDSALISNYSSRPCYYYNGIKFYTRNEWFEQFTTEEKYEAVWNL